MSEISTKELLAILLVLAIILSLSSSWETYKNVSKQLVTLYSGNTFTYTLTDTDLTISGKAQVGGIGARLSGFWDSVTYEYLVFPGVGDCIDTDKDLSEYKLVENDMYIKIGDGCGSTKASDVTLVYESPGIGKGKCWRVRVHHPKCNENTWCSGCFMKTQTNVVYVEGTATFSKAPEIECSTDQDCIDKYRNCDAVCLEGRCYIPTVSHPPKTCPDGSIVSWVGYPTCDYEECPEIEVPPSPPEEEEEVQPINWRATIIGIVVIVVIIGAIGGAVWYLRRR